MGFYVPTSWINRKFDDEGNVLVDGTPYLAKYFNNMESGIKRANDVIDTKGLPLGLATLDENGLVNINQLPVNLKEMEVVYSIDEMEAIEDKFEGLRVMILGDNSWVEYVYDGEKFFKVATSEHLNLTLDWDNIKDKPLVYPAEKHTHKESEITNLDKYSKEETDKKLKGKSDIDHKHTEADITNLDKYSKKEVDEKLKGKSSINHSHSELHSHSNKHILDKLEDLGSHNKIDLDKIYTHTHNYNEILGTPHIPEMISDLNDDVNLVTSDIDRQIFISKTEPARAKEGAIWIKI